MSNNERRAPAPAPLGWVAVYRIDAAHSSRAKPWNVGAFGKGLSNGELYERRIFPTRAEAFAAIDPHKKQTRLWWFRQGYGVRRATWRERELLRFDSGDYKHPVWSDEDFWCYREGDTLDLHYAHVSTDDPSAIAFTETEAKGLADRQTRMKAGRYLKRFFPHLSDRQIAYYAEWQARGEKPQPDWIKRAELGFAKTPDEIVDVYARGPTSCMHDSESVAVYGAGDLAIAYLTRPDVAGASGPEIIARALVWPKKKALGRIYPNVDSWSDDEFSSEAESEAAGLELEKRLVRDGYTSFYKDPAVFNGARIIAEKHDSGGYVMPYIDKLATSGPFKGADGKRYFTLSQYGDHQPDRTDGRFFIAWGRCDHCDEDIDTADDATSVVTSWGRYRRDYSSWCNSCVEDDTFTCEGTDEIVSDSFDYVTVWLSATESETWAEPYLEGRGDGGVARAFECTHLGEWVANDAESERFPGYAEWLDDDATAHPELITETPCESEPEHEQA